MENAILDFTVHALETSDGYGHIRVYMVHGHVRVYMAMYRDTWPCSGIHGHVRGYMAMFGDTWAMFGIHGHCEFP